MADRVRFGPAGFPKTYSKGEEVIRYLRRVGLDALEYQAVRRLPSKREPLERLGEVAKQNDVLLSVHGPYAINLASKDEQKREASIMRLYNSCVVASWMGAFHVTFHPAYYTDDPNETYSLVYDALNRVVEMVKRDGLKVEIAPETTGKPSQFGTVDELIKLSKSLDYVVPTIDFAHIHARYGGKLRERNDFEEILDKIESELGSKVVKNLLIHFSEIEMTKSGVGERRHHDLGSGYGPSFEILAEIIVERGLTPVIISETPSLDIDALKMKKIYLKYLRRKS